MDNFEWRPKARCVAYVQQVKNLNIILEIQTYFFFLQNFYKTLLNYSLKYT